MMVAADPVVMMPVPVPVPVIMAVVMPVIVVGMIVCVVVRVRHADSLGFTARRVNAMAL
ncbi:hypothetical protein [Brevundimonas sp. M20]|uniref:hypothetical protein n=1 Tax=Brevundimonas sp. M20 TaxID=2591463 RepID=UPI001F0FE298|nr:hypothetical protein [Brevundimonas sp. M20]